MLKKNVQMRFLRSNIIISFLFVIIYFSCKKPSPYPIEPVITYDDFVKIKNKFNRDSSSILKFNFTDGDGDLGNTNSVNEFNLFIKYFEQSNGNFKEVIKIDYKDTIINGDTVTLTITDTINFNTSIPSLTPSGNNKAIKGVIEVTLPTDIRYNDTVYYEFYIVDRQNHISNVEKTPVIILN